MEHLKAYNTQGEIRPECLQKAALWVVPTEEIKAVLAMTGWSGVEFSHSTP